MTSRPFSRHPLVQLTLVRIREFMREPEAVFWATMFPIMLSTGLGLAFSARPEPVIAVAAAPALADQLRTEPGLDVRPLAPDAARTALRNGEVALVVEASDAGGVTFLYDDTNPEGRSARAAADRAIQRAAGRVDPVKTTTQKVQEPGSRYIDFLIPGLIGVGIMSNGVWGLGFSIVDTRRRKLTKLLMATPMSKLDYLLSYVIWRVILLPVEVVIPIAFGALAFGVPMRGSWMAVGVLTLLGSMMFSSIGILVGSRVRTIEAISGIINIVIMPMWIVSGVFFSAQRFPEFIQPIIRVLPLTLLIDALRAVELRGAPLGDQWLQMAAMGAWLVATFVAGLALFRWR